MHERIVLGRATRYALFAVAASAALAHAGAQSPSRTTTSSEAAAFSARTPWGDPDLQGTWDFTSITPLERPAEFAGREFLTESEAWALEKRINQ